MFRTLLKKILSFVIVYSGFAFSYYYLNIKRGNNRFRVLVYHRINSQFSENPFSRSMNVSPKDFERQLRFLKKKFNIISLNRIYEIIESNQKIPAGTIAITLDDGYEDNYQNAFPLMMKYSAPATMFLTTGYINTSKIFWWDELELIIENNDIKKISTFINSKLGIKCSKNKSNIYYKLIKFLSSVSELDKQNLIDEFKSEFPSPKTSVYKNLNWKQIQEMVKNRVTFGCHTASHSILSKISQSQVNVEVVQSKISIEDKLEQNIFGFAYPRGSKEDFNDDIIAILKENGYRYAVTNIKGVNKAGDDLFKIKRIPVNGDESFATFICRCYNLY